MKNQFIIIVVSVILGLLLICGVFQLSAAQTPKLETLKPAFPLIQSSVPGINLPYIPRFLLRVDATLSGGITNAFANDTRPRAVNIIKWNREVVDSLASSGGSLALDNNDYPHISYLTYTPNYDYDLSYAHWDGGQWLKEIIDISIMGSTVLRLDSSGWPHIVYSYCNPYSCGLKYVQWTGSQWFTQEIGSGLIDGFSISLALGTDEYPHISYCKQEQVSLALELMHVYWSGSEWHTEIIGNDGCWYSTSIDIDSNGYPHISYYDERNGDLEYARWTGSIWEVQSVDSNGYVGNNNSLSLDLSDHPHISYYDWNNRNLKYASWAGSSWNIQTIDSNDDVGQHNSLALTNNGYPHISYYDDTNGSVKYAYWTGNDWHIEIVQTGIELDWFESISLALDSQNQPHISYRYYLGENNYTLIYAHRVELIVKARLLLPLIIK